MTVRPQVAAPVLVAIACASGCWPGPRRWDGLRCEERSQCAAGWVCAAGRCVPFAVDASAGDGAAVDAASTDGAADGAAIDSAAQDGGGRDVVAPDRADHDTAAPDAAAPDTAAPDAAAADAGAVCGDDYTACGDGSGTCYGGVCRLPGTCAMAVCNHHAPNFPLADTNQRACSNNTTAIACPTSDQEPFYGQDAQYGWDIYHEQIERFTRATAVADEPVVTDNVTHLIWQGCVGGLRGSACDLGAAELQDWATARAYCESLNWGGRDVWFLPTEFELQSIMDYAHNWPSVDATAFPATSYDTFCYWTASTAAGDSASGWCVGIWRGEVMQNSKGTARFARCVTARPPPFAAVRFSRVSDVADEVVVHDAATGLVWQGCAAGLSGTTCHEGSAEARSWQQALAYCETLTWGGHSDWRLPNVMEVRTIVDNRRRQPAVDPVAFPAVAQGTTWCSTNFASQPLLGYVLNLGDGQLSYPIEKASALAEVRCIRAGP